MNRPPDESITWDFTKWDGPEAPSANGNGSGPAGPSPRPESNETPEAHPPTPPPKLKPSPSAKPRASTGTGAFIEVATGIKVSKDDEHSFWERDAHRIIRGWAHARLIAPHALMVCVLQRVLVTVPSYVQLPPIIRSAASLNLLSALVSVSTGGKDGALDVAKEAVHVEGGMPYSEPPAGTGEGLVDEYAHIEGRGATKRTVRDWDAVLMRVSEVDTWAALVERRGSNLDSVIRQAFMGQLLGFGYRTNPTRLEAHTYRLCLAVGVQPGHALSLLGEDSITGGTAGRFLWTPANALDRAPRGERPFDPPPLQVVLPESIAPPSIALPDPSDPHAWTAPMVPNSLQRVAEAGATVPERMFVRVPASVEYAIRDDAWLRAGGELTAVDETEAILDGYGLLLREKVAFALALLEGRAEVSEDDWDLAGHVMAVSRATRTWTREHLAKGAQRKRNSQAIAAKAAARTADRSEQVWQNCARNVLRRLGDPEGLEWMSESSLSEGLSNPQRDRLPDVLETLIERGDLVSQMRSYGYGDDTHLVYALRKRVGQ